MKSSRKSFIGHGVFVAIIMASLCVVLLYPVLSTRAHALASTPLNAQQAPSNAPERIILNAENLILVPDPARSYPIHVRITDENGLPPLPQSAPVTVSLNATKGMFTDSNANTVEVTIGVSEGWRTTVFYRPPTEDGAVTIRANASGLIGDNITLHVTSSSSGGFILDVKANATVVALDGSLNAISLEALLRDANNPNEVVNVSDVPITFVANESRFLESSSAEVTMMLTEGQARVHLQPPQSPAHVNVTAIIDVDLRQSVVITFVQSQHEAEEQPLANLDDVLKPFQSALDEMITFLLSNPFMGIPLIVMVTLVATFGVAKVINAHYRSNRHEKDENAVSLVERIMASFISIIAAISSSRWFRRIDMEQVLENEYRRKIVDYLHRHRISHLRALQQYLKCGTSILMWHLEVLEEYGYVERMKHGQYILYYLTHYRPTSEELKLYLALLNKNSKKIIQIFLRHPNLTIDQIEQLTGLHRKTIKYQLKRLKRLEIIQAHWEDPVNPRSYVLNAKLVPRLKRWMLDRASDGQPYM